VTTVQPAPYQIPVEDPTGWFIVHEGWNPWRPAHLHVTVQAPGMRTATVRLYFRRDQWIGHGAPASAVLDPRPEHDGVDRAVHDFVLDHTSARTSAYTAEPTRSMASPSNATV
jgi:catechol 1,2-dioxygenase